MTLFFRCSIKVCRKLIERWRSEDQICQMTEASARPVVLLFCSNKQFRGWTETTASNSIGFKWSSEIPTICHPMIFDRMPKWRREPKDNKLSKNNCSRESTTAHLCGMVVCQAGGQACFKVEYESAKFTLYIYFIFNSLGFTILYRMSLNAYNWLPKCPFYERRIENCFEWFFKESIHDILK